jgi:hypothetical protein
MSEALARRSDDNESVLTLKKPMTGNRLKAGAMISVPLFLLSFGFAFYVIIIKGRELGTEDFLALGGIVFIFFIILNQFLGRSKTLRPNNNSTSKEINSLPRGVTTNQLPEKSYCSDIPSITESTTRKMESSSLKSASRDGSVEVDQRKPTSNRLRS